MSFSLLHVNLNCRVALSRRRVRAKGFKFQRRHVLDSISRVNPMMSAVRGHSFRIVQQPHSVPCPYALWHIDSDHKLTEPNRILIHRGINGCRVLITHAPCIDYTCTSCNY